MGEVDFFAIFKMHVRVSAVAIFCETPLSNSTHGYYKLVEYQLLYSFVPHLPGPLNMVAKIELPLKFHYIDMLQFSKCTSA